MKKEFWMKRGISIVLSALLLSTMSVVPSMAAEQVYTDVPADSWYYEAASYTAEKGLFSGTGNSQFSPDKTMTRGMFVTVLGRMDGGAENTAAAGGFTDVDVDAYYAPYVSWASANGIVNGTGNGTFSPDSDISREQMCAIFVRYLRDYLKQDLSDYQASVDIFADADEISSWAVSEVALAQAMGLVQGSDSEDGMIFRPQASVTRAEAATITMRFDQTFSSGEGETEDPGEEPENPGDTDNPAGGGGGGTVPDDDQPEYTEEEIAEEALVASYIESMCSNYDRFPSSMQGPDVDPDVKECLGILIGSLKDVLQKRESGVFMSSDYVMQTYADEISEFKSIFNSLDDEQMAELRGKVLLLTNESEAYYVLDYFGITSI